MTTTHRPHRTHLLAAAAVGGLALVGTLSSGLVGADAADVGADPALVEVLPVLDEPSDTGDTLPTFLTEGDQELVGLDADSTRSLGTTDDGTRLWAGVDAAGDGCVVALIPGPDEFAAMSCTDSADIAAGDLTLTVHDGEHGTRASIVPDGYEAPAGVETLGEQVVLTDPLRPLTELPLTPDDAAEPTVSVPAQPAVGP